MVIAEFSLAAVHPNQQTAAPPSAYPLPSAASLLADGRGNEISGTRTTYYPFGGFRTTPTVELTDRGYTGHAHDNLPSNDLGLIYMNARFYVPSLGRFASADSIVPNAADPQSYNRYSYGYNNPIRFTDPSGHCGADATEQLIDQCITLRDELAGYYQIEIIGSWTLAELLSVQAALIDIENALEGVTFFHKIFSGTQLVRDRNHDTVKSLAPSNVGKQLVSTLASHVSGGRIKEIDYGTPARAEAKNGVITFYNDSFLNPNLARWAVIHEFGHVFDSKAFWPDENFFSAGLKNASPSARMELYIPSEEEDIFVSPYAGSNRFENFAETWTATIFEGNWDVMSAGSPGFMPRNPASASGEAFIWQEIHSLQVSAKP